MKCLLAFLFTVLLVTPAAGQDALSGTVTHVRDGDTIEVTAPMPDDMQRWWTNPEVLPLDLQARPAP